MQQSLRDDETASGFGFKGGLVTFLDVGDKIVVTLCEFSKRNLFPIFSGNISNWDQN